MLKPKIKLSVRLFQEKSTGVSFFYSYNFNLIYLLTAKHSDELIMNATLKFKY